MNGVCTVPIPPHGPSCRLLPGAQAGGFCLCSLRLRDYFSSVRPPCSGCLGRGDAPSPEVLVVPWERRRGPGRRPPSTAGNVMEPWELGARGRLCPERPRVGESSQARRRPSRVLRDEDKLIGDRHVGRGVGSAGARAQSGSGKCWSVTWGWSSARTPGRLGRPEQVANSNTCPQGHSFCKVRAEPREGAPSPCATQTRALAEHSAFGLASVAAAVGATPWPGG